MRFYLTFIVVRILGTALSSGATPLANTDAAIVKPTSPLMCSGWPKTCPGIIPGPSQSHCLLAVYTIMLISTSPDLSGGTCGVKYDTSVITSPQQPPNSEGCEEFSIGCDLCLAAMVGFEQPEIAIACEAFIVPCIACSERGWFCPCAGLVPPPYFKCVPPRPLLPGKTSRDLEKLQ